MTDKTLSSVTGGGGGGFVTKFSSGAITLSAGASGDIITLTPPAGQIVKITGLVAITADQTGMTVAVNGADVITSLTLGAGGSSSGEFSIGGLAPNAAFLVGTGEISGSAGDIIVIKKDVGSTDNAILYSYQFGE